MAGDQAAGLKRWSEQQSVRSRAQDPRRTMLVIGHPDGQRGMVGVKLLLEYWANLRYSWVGNPDEWEIILVAAEAPNLPMLVKSWPRWGLWVHRDSQGFRRAYQALATLARAGGPDRVLALHEPGMTTRGLLNNLRQAALEFLGVELRVLE